MSREVKSASRVSDLKSLLGMANRIAAAEAIGPVKEGQRLANHWLSQAIDLGGTAGGIALARKAARLALCIPAIGENEETLAGAGRKMKT